MHKRMDSLDWTLCRTFLAVLDEGTFSGAAKALGLTQPTVGRQITQLEAVLGVSLFVRAARGLRPTDAALDLQVNVRRMAAAAAAIARTASGSAEAVSGVVRITASEIIGAEVLPPMLASFRRLHPGVIIELDLSNRVQDISGGEADIAVRMTRPVQETLVTRRIGDVGLGLYAHRDYLADHPTPTDEASLRASALVGFDRETPFLRALGKQLGVSRDDFSLRAESDLAQIAALRAGLGVGFIQHGIARRDPGLVPVWPDGPTVTLEIWLTTHQDLRASRRVRLMMEHLADGLAAYVAASC